MNIGIMIVGLGILTVLSILVYRTNKEQDETCEADAQPKRDLYKEAQTEMAVNPYANEKTQSLLIDTLKEMGGTIRGINKEDLRIHYEYQGHSFLLDSMDGCLFIKVWDPCWYDIPLDDIDQLSLMRRVINLANQNESCSLFYTMDTENRVATIHSKKHIVFVSSLFRLDKYLHSVFTDFFHVERRFITELERARKMDKVNV